MCTGRLASLLYRRTHHNASASTQYSRLHLAWDIYKSVGVVWDFVGWPHCRVDRHLGDGHEYPAMDLSSKHLCHLECGTFLLAAKRFFCIVYCWRLITAFDAATHGDTHAHRVCPHFPCIPVLCHWGCNDRGRIR
jgi:hypothetical protein